MASRASAQMMSCLRCVELVAVGWVLRHPLLGLFVWLKVMVHSSMLRMMLSRGAVPFGRCFTTNQQAVSFLLIGASLGLGGRFGTSSWGTLPAVLVLMCSTRESRIRGGLGARCSLPSAPNPLLPLPPTPSLAAQKGRMLQQLAMVSSLAVRFCSFVHSVFVSTLFKVYVLSLFGHPYQGGWQSSP